MTAGPWQELEELLDALLQLPAHERATFLDRACAGRPAMRQELVELAASHERRSPLDGPVAGFLERSVVGPVGPGTEIVARFRILRRLGQGGMGVVYQAHDLRLGRALALKFLHAHLSADPAAKERLRVEARAAAGLDHLNICTIHEIGEAEGGLLFIAMPYYEGETLKARMARGPLPPDEAIALAIQAAQGLAKAHEHGVVHRDIKPANLMITADGVLKILDFGIAKLPGTELSQSGELLGTVAYMSPEQLGNEPVDGRTDIWSLGVVFHEMLTGERPFDAPHAPAIIHAILHRQHDPVRSRHPALSEAADRVLAGMLAKDPADRYRAADLIRELERLRHAASATTRTGGPDAEAPPEVLPEGERRQVTVLVSAVAADERLADSRFARLRAVADEVVRRHGGVVNHLSGGALVALFGVPATHEDDPLRAVRASLELHRRARELGERVESEAPGPRLRSGIHTGSVAVQPASEAGRAFQITGDIADLALALARHAPSDEIWVSADCRRAVSRFVDTQGLAPVALLPGGPPVIPSRVLAVSPVRSRLEAAEQMGLTAFTGRQREMMALRQALEEAAGGQGRFVTVVGDAGVGKSRLLLELRQVIARAGAGLLQGHCEPSESPTTYLPFVETLRDWLGTGRGERMALASDAVVARLRELGPELEEFIPLYLHLLALSNRDHPVPRHLHGEHFRLAMQEALAAFVTLRARRQPTVLLLEDWHWADEASHGVLQQVAELVTDSPLLLVVTCRPGYVRGWGHPSHHLPLALEPLDAGSSGSMLRSILGVETVPEALVELLHGRTGGNPFFLEEITQTLLEEGALGVEQGAAILTGSLDLLQLPETVQSVIRARLDRLDRGAREVLRVASVVGREFARGILERVVDAAHLPHALQTLKATGVIQQIRVVPEPAYRFKHVLTQEAAAASLLEHQRKELHGRVGAAIEALYRDDLNEHLGRLVEHFSRAEHWSKAVEYALRSAERANALSEFAESLDLLERAQSWLLRRPDDGGRRDLLIDILFRQERLCETLGLRARQQRIIDELVQLLEPSSEPARLAEAYLRQGDLSTLLRRFEDAEAALERALDLRRRLGDAAGERNTLRSLGLLRWHQGRDDDALRCMEAALAMARERGDVEAQVGDLANLGTVLKGMGEPERARRALQEALELSARLEAGNGDVPATDLSFKRAYILHNLANVHRGLGDDATALEYLTQARTMMAGKRLPIQLSYHLTSIAHIFLQHGRVEDSLTLYGEAIELTRKAKFAPGLAQALRFLGEVLLGLDRSEEALVPLEEAAGLFAEIGGEPATEALLWTQVATLRERRGELEGAFAAWSKARALHGRTGDQASELAVLEGFARVARGYLPEPSLALGCYAEALALAERLGDAPAVGRLRNAMGIIEWERGRYDEARAHYEAGLGIFRDLEDSANAALMLASLGVTLNAMGRRVEARRCLEEARGLHHGAGDRLAEARDLGALTDVLMRLGETERAIECGERALQLRRECGDRAGEGWMLHRLALAHAAEGSADRARECAIAAARIAGETGDRDLAAACHELPRAFGR